MSKRIIVLVLFILFLVLANTVLQMPEVGLINHPAYNEVAKFYLENARQDTGAVNVIASIITDYRAFDTLGETTVLFTAIAAVFSVLSVKGEKHE